MTYINTRGWLRRMGARIGGASWFDWGGGLMKGLGALPPPLCMLKNALIYTVEIKFVSTYDVERLAYATKIL